MNYSDYTMFYILSKYNLTNHYDNTHLIINCTEYTDNTTDANKMDAVYGYSDGSIKDG